MTLVVKNGHIKSNTSLLTLQTIVESTEFHGPAGTELDYQVTDYQFIIDCVILFLVFIFMLCRDAATYTHPLAPNRLPQISSASFQRNCCIPGLHVWSFFNFCGIQIELLVVLIIFAGTVTRRGSIWFNFFQFMDICFCLVLWMELQRYIVVLNLHLLCARFGMFMGNGNVYALSLDTLNPVNLFIYFIAYYLHI